MHLLIQFYLLGCVITFIWGVWASNFFALYIDYYRHLSIFQINLLKIDKYAVIENYHDSQYFGIQAGERNCLQDIETISDKTAEINAIRKFIALTELQIIAYRAQLLLRRSAMSWWGFINVRGNIKWIERTLNIEVDPNVIKLRTDPSLSKEDVERLVKTIWVKNPGTDEIEFAA